MVRFEISLNLPRRKIGPMIDSILEGLRLYVMSSLFPLNVPVLVPALGAVTVMI